MNKNKLICILSLTFLFLYSCGQETELKGLSNDPDPSIPCESQKLTRVGMNACKLLEVRTTEKHMEGLSYPNVTDHVWIVNNKSVSPLCLETMWVSRDNYQLYEDQYPQAEGFIYYPGKYWGNKVSLDPIKTSWGAPYSMASSLEMCNKIDSNDSTSTKKNIFSYTYESVPGDLDRRVEYTLLAEWNREGCSKVMPQLSGQCQSLAFVKLDTTYKNLMIEFNSYAHIIVKDKAYIVPVTNGMPLEDLLKLIESN